MMYLYYEKTLGTIIHSSCSDRATNQKENARVHTYKQKRMATVSLETRYKIKKKGIIYRKARLNMSKVAHIRQSRPRPLIGGKLLNPASTRGIDAATVELTHSRNERLIEEGSGVGGGSEVTSCKVALLRGAAEADAPVLLYLSSARANELAR